jgi:hypothetical protein
LSNNPQPAVLSNPQPAVLSNPQPVGLRNLQPAILSAGNLGLLTGIMVSTAVAGEMAIGAALDVGRMVASQTTFADAWPTMEIPAIIWVKLDKLLGSDFVGVMKGDVNQSFRLLTNQVGIDCRILVKFVNLPLRDFPSSSKTVICHEESKRYFLLDTTKDKNNIHVYSIIRQLLSTDLESDSIYVAANTFIRHLVGTKDFDVNTMMVPGLPTMILHIFMHIRNNNFVQHMTALINYNEGKCNPIIMKYLKDICTTIQELDHEMGRKLTHNMVVAVVSTVWMKMFCVLSNGLPPPLVYVGHPLPFLPQLPPLLSQSPPSPSPLSPSPPPSPSPLSPSPSPLSPSPPPSPISPNTQ